MSEDRPIRDTNTVRVVKNIPEPEPKAPQSQEDLDWRPVPPGGFRSSGGYAHEPELKAIRYPTPTADRIMTGLVPEWRDQFLEKNAGYGEDHDPLGPAGEFVEIYRKAKKLRRALWDKHPIGDETTREVTMDLIGHCFLLIDLLDGGGNFALRLDIEDERDDE
jgi:hypothetical protein